MPDYYMLLLYDDWTALLTVQPSSRTSGIGQISLSARISSRQGYIFRTIYAMFCGIHRFAIRKNSSLL
jgi:hypothetical protein